MLLIFFCAANDIFSQIKSSNNPTVMLPLTDSFCVPVYKSGITESACCIVKHDWLCHHRIFCKVYVMESNTIATCDSDFLPAFCLLELMMLQLYYGLLKLHGLLPLRLFQLMSHSALSLKRTINNVFWRGKRLWPNLIVWLVFNKKFCYSDHPPFFCNRVADDQRLAGCCGGVLVNRSSSATRFSRQTAVDNWL